MTPHKVPWSGRTIIELSWEYPEPHTAKKKIKYIQAGELLFLKLTLTLCFYLEHSGRAQVKGSECAKLLGLFCSLQGKVMDKKAAAGDSGPHSLSENGRVKGEGMKSLSGLGF